MATGVKIKNGAIGVDAVVELAAEAKVAVDTMVETATKVNENGLSMLTAHQQMMKNGFEMWQKCNQGYYDFFLDMSQKTFDQSLTFRQELGRVLESSFKHTQEVVSDEQTLAFEAVEAVQAQLHAVTERVGKLFTPVVEQ